MYPCHVSISCIHVGCASAHCFRSNEYGVLKHTLRETPMKRLTPLLLIPFLIAFLPAPAPAAEPARLPNPFYAMDTAFNRPGLSRDQQFALVKDLGYDGVAWTEQAPDQVKAALAEVEAHGLKMFTLYSAAKVTPDGDLTYSPQ